MPTFIPENQDNETMNAQDNPLAMETHIDTPSDGTDDMDLWLFDVDDDSFRKALLALDNINETFGDVTDSELDASSSTTTSHESFAEEEFSQNKRMRVRAAADLHESFQSPFDAEDAIFAELRGNESLTKDDDAPTKLQCLETSSVDSLCRPAMKNSSGGGTKRCEELGCSKFPQGGTRFCIAHGGGRRCTFANCTKGARDRFFCAAHGGGRRCSAEGCSKAAVGGSERCATHGGGRKCQHDGCIKSAQSPTSFCVMHGGGRKCSKPGCSKVARGRTAFCAAHGGGQRCEVPNCGRAAIAKHKTCRSHTKTLSFEDINVQV